MLHTAIDSLNLAPNSLQITPAPTAPAASETSGGSAAKRRRVVTSAQLEAKRDARTKGREPRRTMIANAWANLDAVSKCGSGKIDISKTRACPNKGRCREVLLRSFPCLEAYCEWVIGQREERLRAASNNPPDKIDCFPDTSTFSHAVAFKRHLDVNATHNGKFAGIKITLHGVGLCVTAAASVLGHTDTAVKAAIAWWKDEQGGPKFRIGDDISWIEKKRQKLQSTTTRVPVKAEDAKAWLLVNIPVLACSPPNLVDVLVLNMNVSRELFDLYISDRYFPRSSVHAPLTVWSGRSHGLVQQGAWKGLNQTAINSLEPTM